MARYLVVANYSPEGVQGLLSGGGSARRAAVSEMVGSLGGTVETFDFAFGEDDVYVVCEMPDNVSVAAVGLAVGASGLASVRTVVLLSPEEIDAAAAKHASYRGPGQ